MAQEAPVPLHGARHVTIVGGHEDVAGDGHQVVQRRHAVLVILERGQLLRGRHRLLGDHVGEDGREGAHPALAAVDLARGHVDERVQRVPHGLERDADLAGRERAQPLGAPLRRVDLLLLPPAHVVAHGAQLRGLPRAQPVRAPGEGQHVLLVSQVQRDEGAPAPQPVDDLVGQVADVRVEGERAVVGSAPQALDVGVDSVVGQPRVRQSEADHAVLLEQRQYLVHVVARLQIEERKRATTRHINPWTWIDHSGAFKKEEEFNVVVDPSTT